MKDNATKPTARARKPRTFSGNLHWYTTPEIHQRLARNAEMKGFTIRDYIEQALIMQMEMDRNLFETD